MNSKEIRELSLPELDQKLRATRGELLELRIKKQTGQVEKTHQITALRKDVARMESIRAQKARETQKSA